nr:DNA ligase 1-like [Hydra vulgaris]
MNSSLIEIDTDNIGPTAIKKSYCQAVSATNKKQPIRYSILSRTLLSNITQNITELDVLTAIEDAGLDKELEAFQIIRNGTMIELIMKTDKAKSSLQENGLCVKGVIHNFHNSTPTRNISKRIAVSVIGLPLEKKGFPVGVALEELGYGKHIHTRPVFKKTPKNKTPYFSGILVVIIDNLLKPIPRNLRLKGYNLRIVYTGQELPENNKNKNETPKIVIPETEETLSSEKENSSGEEKEEATLPLNNEDVPIPTIVTTEPEKVATLNELTPCNTERNNDNTNECSNKEDITTEELEDGEINIPDELECLNHLEMVEHNWKLFKNFDRYNCSEEELQKLKIYKKVEWDQFESERRNYRALENDQKKTGKITPFFFENMDSGEIYAYNKKEFKNHDSEECSSEETKKYVAYKKAEWDQRKKEFDLFVKIHEVKQEERKQKFKLNQMKKQKRKRFNEETKT